MDKIEMEKIANFRENYVKSPKNKDSGCDGSFWETIEWGRGENFVDKVYKAQNLLPKSQGFTVQNKILTLYNGSRGQESAKYAQKMIK